MKRNSHIITLNTTNSDTNIKWKICTEDIIRYNIFDLEKKISGVIVMQTSN
ncbi:MAG: hypothetical protein AWU57_1577 [Marinobacter sp. T13-3]|nr:MAG: hypothetical protein AWU57_1577 [Marinobacter sp. T13-3]